ncbi:MAG: hypothetical protein AAFW47_07175 [Pseudomonadota bacterium]
MTKNLKLQTMREHGFAVQCAENGGYIVRISSQFDDENAVVAAFSTALEMLEFLDRHMIDDADPLRRAVRDKEEADLMEVSVQKEDFSPITHRSGLQAPTA